MRRILKAQPYDPSEIGSLGKASCMLIRQWQFPVDNYDERDCMVTADHDHVMNLRYSDASACFVKFTGTGELGFGYWVMSTQPNRVIAFLRDYLKADPTINWTGFRILQTTHRGNGRPVWTMQLFAKHADSQTCVEDKLPTAPKRRSNRLPMH